MDTKMEQARLRKQRQRERDKDLGLRDILQWGIDTGGIRVRDIVARTYGLTQKYGSARLEKHELLELLNNDLKRKKMDTRLYFLGAPVQRGSLADGYMYSNEM